MNLKKFLLSVLTVTLCLALASCSIFGEVDGQGDVTVVVECEDGEYEVFEVSLEKVENKSEGVFGVLEHLRDREDDPLYLEVKNGGYGAYVTAIGAIREDSSSGAYVMVYTSVAEDSYESAPTVEYGGVTLYQSGVSISGMHASSGSVILFRLEKY